ncbi:hypothetical protein MMC25_001375 [Agyrium rufum]|nr:hypothetical protein [Agyrium rufum]
MPKLKFATLDVFTTKALEGNPLVVVQIPSGTQLTQEKKQRIAQEFNLSETVFLHGSTSNSELRVIDIFTVSAELPFAGHPTIGCLCYIAQCEQPSSAKSGVINLRLKSGVCEAYFDTSTREAAASIPHDTHLHAATISPEDVFASQPNLIEGIERSVNRNPVVWEGWKAADEQTKLPVFSIVKGMTFMLIDVPAIIDGLESLGTSSIPIPFKADLLDEGWKDSFIAPYFYTILPSNTSRTQDKEDEENTTNIRARMIEPSFGEDPATGSAACALAAYLSLHGKRSSSNGPNSTYSFRIEQGVEMGRPSLIHVQVILDASGKRIGEVLLKGTAVLVSEGTMYV